MQVGSAPLLGGGQVGVCLHVQRRRWLRLRSRESLCCVEAPNEKPRPLLEDGAFNFQSASSALPCRRFAKPPPAPCRAVQSAAVSSAVLPRPSSVRRRLLLLLAPPRPTAHAIPVSTNFSCSLFLSPSAPPPRTPVEGSCSRSSFLPPTEQYSADEVSTISTAQLSTHTRRKFSRDFFARDVSARKEL